MARVRAFPATLTFPLSFSLTPFIPREEKLGKNKLWNKNFKYLKKALYFQKLTLCIVRDIQLENKVGSFSFKERYVTARDSFRETLGPMSRWKPLTRCVHKFNWAFS